MAGSSSEQPDHNLNKRADMWQRGREWFRSGGAIWKSEKLKRQITGMETTPNAKGKLQMELKENFIKRIGASPDEAEAFFLTLAYETTELLSIEYVEAGEDSTSRSDYDQWSDAALPDAADERYDRSRERQRQRLHYQGD